MDISKPSRELAIVFVWNSDNSCVNDFITYAEKMLSRETEKPFSRELDIPLFFHSGNVKAIPSSVYVKANKIIIYPVTDREIAVDDNWTQYLNTLLNIENSIVVPVAYEENSIISEGGYRKLHCIRAYDFKEYKNEQLFIRIAHEIFRYGFNEKLAKLGTDSALKIFISHAKAGGTGITVASKIKNFLDQSVIKSFFDACSIAPGYRFDEEIENNIKDSTVVLVNSDMYSARHWCQKEILAAKRFERPIVEIDALEEGADRKFPYAANIPIVRINLADGIDDYEILRILTASLLETIRFYYTKAKMQELESLEEVKLCYRPPEISDLEKIICKDKNEILRCSVNEIIYPDPPVYSEEIEFLEKIGLTVNTPVIRKAGNLLGKTVGISISDVSDEEMCLLGQNKSHLLRLSQMVFRYLICMKSSLVYGGDLRNNGFTEYLTTEARLLKERLNLTEPCIKNFLSWPIYLNDTAQVKEWKAANKEFVKIIEVEPDEGMVKNNRVFVKPDTPQHLYLWAQALTKMRTVMISTCDARIVAGGRLYGYKGKMPGVLEEILIASKNNIPFYLLGGFGGVGRAVGECIFSDKIPVELSDKWQKEHTPGLEAVLNLYKDFGELVTYGTILQEIRQIQLNNGLSEEENKILYHSVYVDEIMELILKGMKNIFQN